MPIASRKPTQHQSAPCLPIDDQLSFLDYCMEVGTYRDWSSLNTTDKQKCIEDYLSEETLAEFTGSVTSNTNYQVVSPQLHHAFEINISSITVADRQIFTLLTLLANSR